MRVQVNLPPALLAEWPVFYMPRQLHRGGTDTEQESAQKANSGEENSPATRVKLVSWCFEPNQPLGVTSGLIRHLNLQPFDHESSALLTRYPDSAICYKNDQLSTEFNIFQSLKFDSPE